MLLDQDWGLNMQKSIFFEQSAGRGGERAGGHNKSVCIVELCMPIIFIVEAVLQFKGKEEYDFMNITGFGGICSKTWFYKCSGDRLDRSPVHID